MLPVLLARPPPAQLAESPSSERILEAVARLEGAILWDRVREESLELSRRIDLAQAQQAQHTQQQQQPLKQEPQLAGAEAVLGSPDAPPVRVRVPHRAGAGLGKRPRLLMGAGGSAGSGSAAGGGGSACCAGAYSSASGQELCSRASLFELCARGDADWEHVLAEAPVPTREQLLSGPAAERVPAAALRMLALLESAGLGGRHEGAVVTQLLELVHRHAASILADAHDCCVHRADARDPSAPGLGGARLCAQDVRMAVEMDVIVLAQAAPPPREYLASSGCGAINAMPLPLLPDGGLGVALPRRADCLASLHR